MAVRSLPLLVDQPVKAGIPFKARVCDIEIEDGFNPRRDYGEQDGTFSALVDSVREHGVLQPVLVRTDPEVTYYVLVAGHRRMLAAQTVGLEHIPAMLLPEDNVGGEGVLTALALAENLQRRDLNPLEEAEGYRRLEALGWSQELIGKTVGRSQPHVSRALSLLRLPDATRALIREGQLTASHGAELVRLVGTTLAERIQPLAEKYVEFGWPVGSLRNDVTRAVQFAKDLGEEVQTALPVDPEPRRDHATSHNRTEAEERTRGAGEGTDGVKAGYTPEQAREEFAASQRPDPDVPTPIKDRVAEGAARREAADQREAAEQAALEEAAPRIPKPGTVVHPDGSQTVTFTRDQVESMEEWGGCVRDGVVDAAEVVSATQWKDDPQPKPREGDVYLHVLISEYVHACLMGMADQHLPLSGCTVWEAEDEAERLLRQAARWWNGGQVAMPVPQQAAELLRQLAAIATQKAGERVSPEGMLETCVRVRAYEQGLIAAPTASPASATTEGEGAQEGGQG